MASVLRHLRHTKLVIVSLLTASIWVIETVDLGINQSTPITIPRGQAANLEANFELDDKLETPLAKGQVVGKLYLQLDGEDVASYP